MRVLVTGGAGYIGSHTLKALASEGHQPVVFDNFSTGHRWAVRWGQVEEGDLADRERIRAVLQKHSVEAVVHFAGSAYVGESVSNPAWYYRNNFVNTLNLLEEMNAAGVKRIIFSSSCTVYGIPEALPIPETAKLDPISPYGESKRFIERMLHSFEAAYGLQWLALRYFNAAGADPDGELGEQHDPETHLIPLAVLAALGKIPQFSMFGVDYETPDGTAVRDFIHVTDLAQAHVAALRFLSEHGTSMPLNLATGVGESVGSIIRAVERLSGRPIPVERCPRRAGDPAVLIADPSRASELLNWRPRYGIDTILQTAIRWHSRNDSK